MQELSVNSLLNILLLSSHPMKRNSQNRNKEFDDVSTSVKLTGVHVLIETANQILEYISHINCTDLFGGEITSCITEICDDLIQS